MIKAVFTGPAIDGHGNSILRANLIKACQAKGGITVQPKVDHSTTVLVASRTDTVKALAALEKGIMILTYPEFISRYLAGVEIAKEGIPSRYTDKINPDLLVPDFTAEFSAADLL